MSDKPRATRERRKVSLNALSSSLVPTSSPSTSRFLLRLNTRDIAGRPHRVEYPAEPVGLARGVGRDLHAAPIDEVDGQGLAAGVVEPLGRVALAQADELVAWRTFAHGRRPVEEALSELGHRRSVLGCAAYDSVRGPEGVGGEFRSSQ